MGYLVKKKMNKENNTLILTVGLPRSGKSTWAIEQSQDYGIPIVNPDSIRLALHGQAFIREAEPFVWAIAKVMVSSLFLAGHDRVIVDATNTTKERRNFWADNNWELYLQVFDATKEVCISRAKATEREDLIPVIERMAEKFEPIILG